MPVGRAAILQPWGWKRHATVEQEDRGNPVSSIVMELSCLPGTMASGLAVVWANWTHLGKPLRSSVVHAAKQNLNWYSVKGNCRNTKLCKSHEEHHSQLEGQWWARGQGWKCNSWRYSSRSFLISTVTRRPPLHHGSNWGCRVLTFEIPEEGLWFKSGFVPIFPFFFFLYSGKSMLLLKTPLLNL